MKPRTIPEKSWFLEQNALLAHYWKATPWHQDGDRLAATLKPAIQKHARFLRELPDNFIPSVMDQYLAAVWQASPKHNQDHDGVLRAVRAGKDELANAIARFGLQSWPFRSFVVRDKLGDDRFWCRDDRGNEFGLHSPSLSREIAEGARLFLAQTIEAGNNWHLTYGPLLGWTGLVEEDLAELARAVAAQTFDKGGIDAVIRFNPVPFWAAWKWARIPLTVHKESPMVNCWLNGALPADFDTVLPRTWTRQDAGRLSRWVYRDDHPMRQRIVYRNNQTGKALVFGSRPDDYNKAISLLGSRFEQEDDQPRALSLLMQVIIKELIGKAGELEAWEKPFSKFEG